MKGDNFTQKLDDLIDRYKLWIGSFLLLIILLGSGVLLYQRNLVQGTLEDKVASLEAKINDLESFKNKSNISQDVTNTTSPVGASPEPSSTTSTDNGEVRGAATKPAVSGVVNINTATLAELDSLPGIGTTYAQRIIDYRKTNGPFRSIEELKNVKGIGDKTFEKLKDKISI